MNNMQQVIDFVRVFPEAILTGSRFFGTDTPASDYDFFIEDSERIKAALSTYGYRMEAKNLYNDINTAEVWKKGCIHVQLTKDIALKLRAQQFIKSAHDNQIPLLIPGNKLHNRKVWNWVFTVITTMRI